MGYIAISRPDRKQGWQVKYRTESNGKRTHKDVKQEEYVRLGFSSCTTKAQAQEVCRTLNSDLTLKALQEKRHTIGDRLKKEDLILSICFPSALVKEFESLYLDPQNKKHICHWRAAKRLIAEVKGLNIEPCDWADNKEQFYQRFKARTWSFSHSEKVLFMVNKWGTFFSRKHRTYFDAIPLPSGRHKETLVDKHYDKKGSTASNPITPAELEARRSRFSAVQSNWLYLSIWLGLRPIEVDSLKKPSGPMSWYLQNTPDGTILWVYQSKLTGIPRNERLKPIVIKYPEQAACLDIIKSKQFQRPLVKTLNKYFTLYVNCYAGRKGFTDLMLPKGNSLEAISQWLGHKDLNRTWGSYKNHSKVLLK